MTKHLKKAGFAAALLGLAQPHAAFAQDCVQQSDVNDAVIYAAPSLIEAFEGKCGANLSPAGFLATQGDGMASAFAERRDAVWPGTLRLIERFSSNGRLPGGDNDGGFVAMLGAMPEDAVRPFIDAMIVQQVGQTIPLKECKNIERGLSLLAPLPPENVGGLAAFLFEMANVKDPQICPYEAE